MTLGRRDRALRIGCASGFWGDSLEGAVQLVERGRIDYLVFDYLAEITMSLLARARAKSPDMGYVPDFVRVIARVAPQLRDRRIKVVANAGGVNPAACAQAMRKELEAIGIGLIVAVVDGDDLSADVEALRTAGAQEMFTGEPLPPKLLSINAYLGAQPIAAALAAGADIVITGRVVDSAVTLGPLVHEFCWSWDDWDKLACGSLAGHIIECGTQCTGGIFTDWEKVPGWDDMGYPIAECDPGGAHFIITKPEGTGGLVTPATVGEQVLYEIGDPAAYLLPDVCCDFRQVRLEQAGADRVRVSGMRGQPAPPTYKVSATYAEGWRLLGTLMIGGAQAAAKAQRVGESLLRRAERLCATRGFPAFTETSLEVLGAEATYGPHSRAQSAREVVLKIAAKHPSKEPLELLAREIIPSASSMAQGITGFAAGRPSPSPVVRLFSILVPRGNVKPQVTLDGERVDFREVHTAYAAGAGELPPALGGLVAPAQAGPGKRVPLLSLAHGRSGDKADTANIGILARSPGAYEFLRAVLTPESVASYMAHLVSGRVHRYELPGMLAFNFVLERALGGGGVSSLRYDPQGKAYAQMLLDMELEAPQSVLSTLP